MPGAVPPTSPPGAYATSIPSPNSTAPSSPIKPELLHPIYSSWEDYLSNRTPNERLARCQAKATKAKRPRLLPGAPTVRTTARDVLSTLVAAQGRYH